MPFYSFSRYCGGLSYLKERHFLFILAGIKSFATLTAIYFSNELKHVFSFFHIEVNKLKFQRWWQHSYWLSKVFQPPFLWEKNGSPHHLPIPSCLDGWSWVILLDDVPIRWLNHSVQSREVVFCCCRWHNIIRLAINHLYNRMRCQIRVHPFN